MSRVADRFIRLADITSSVATWIASFCCLALVLCTVFDVALRYLFQSGLIAVQELEWHLFALVFLLGAAGALKADAHVRVDIFYSRFSKKNKALVDFLGTLLFLLPFSAFVVYTSLPFVEMSFSITEGSADPGGLPYRFIIKSAIPLGFALLFLSGISKLLKDAATFFSSEAS